MHRVLSEIGKKPFSQRFYLAGGTALALQIGHRRSIDFDFFSETDDLGEKSRAEIIHGLADFSVQIIENTTGNLFMLVDGIRTGFFGYGYPLVGKPVLLENIALASQVDIGLMKCDALISRGSRKDFYDLFYIARTEPIDSLLGLGEKKYPQLRDFPLMVLESMTLFDNAERDVQPELFEPVPWEQVKQFFLKQARLISNRWFS